jgi:hypothetical protein
MANKASKKTSPVIDVNPFGSGCLGLLIITIITVSVILIRF